MNEKIVPYRPGMTLNPGESTSVSIPIALPEGANGEAFRNLDVSFTEVPPPAEAPVQDIAETLGLVAGLRAERRDPSRGSDWRCANCGRMQDAGAWEVWVPDGVQRDHTEARVTELCRRNAYNGHHSAWCLKCAPKAAKKKTVAQTFFAPTVSSTTPNAPPLSLWKRFLALFE